MSDKIKTRNAAAAVIEALIEEEVPVVFGMTGDTILPIIDAIYHRQDKIRYVTTKYEMSTVAMADGYSRVTNRLGVCAFHVGPSISNAVQGVWTAQKDSVPLLILSANMDRFRLGRNIWHEFDVVGVFSKITKRADQMLEAKDANRLMRTSIQVAKSGLPGCVSVDFPKDLLAQPADVESSDLSLRGGPTMHFVSNRARPAAPAVAEALRLLEAAQQPVFIAGRGVAWSEAEETLVSLAEHLGIPVVSTEMGRGSISEHHPLSPGMIGHFGMNTANTILKEADLVIGLGCQFGNVSTLNWQLINADAKIIQVEPEPGELGRQYAVDCGVHADVGEFLTDLNALVRSRGVAAPKDRSTRVQARIAELQRQEKELYYNADLSATPIKSQLIVSVLEKLAPQKSLFTIGAGYNMHFSNFLKLKGPRKYHVAAGSGSMAWAFPAALGMKLAQPDHTVFVLLGDGDFSMCAQELETAVREKLPVVVMLYNDVSYGALHIFQKHYYGGRVLGSDYGDTDWVALARAYGALGVRVDHPNDLEAAVAQAIKADLPTVIDVRIELGQLAHRTPEFASFHRF